MLLGIWSFSLLRCSLAEHFDDCMFVAKLVSRKPFAELLWLGWPGYRSGCLSLSLPWLLVELYQAHISDDAEAPSAIRFASQFERVFYDADGCQVRLRVN